MVIPVSTVEELYGAVNDATHDYATVALSAGTYVLSTTDGLGVARPNAGALRLRQGMVLVGSEVRHDIDGDGVPDPFSGDQFAAPQTETVIDGSAISPPQASRTDCTGEVTKIPDPIIHLADATIISALTIKAGANAAVSEPGTLSGSTVSLTVTVTSTVLDGATPMGFSNSGCATRGAQSSLTFNGNVVRNLTGPGGQGGLNITNLRNGAIGDAPADGPTIDAHVSHNRFYNNVTAIAIRGGAQGTDGGSVTVHSDGNLFENNGINILAMGGFARAATTATASNRAALFSTGDTFGPATNTGAVVLFGAKWPGPAVGAPNADTLTADLSGSRFLKNPSSSVPELYVAGDTGVAGANNYAELNLHGASVRTTTTGAPTTGTLVINDAQPTAGNGNTARLTGTRSAFATSNPDFSLPAATWFLVNESPRLSLGGPYAATLGSSVSLSMSANDPDGDGVSLTWNFGDGTAGVGTPPASHLYTSAGTYTITLTANDGRGGVTNGSTTATIGPVTVSTSIWLGLKNSDDVGTVFDVKVDAFHNGIQVRSDTLFSVPGGSSGFNNAVQRTLNSQASSSVSIGDSVTISVRIAVGATGHRSGTARLWYDDAAANSRIQAVNDGVTTYYLHNGLVLGESVGAGPKRSIDVTVDRLANGNAFKAFGSWRLTM